ncbi:DinB family protein [Cohnella herbarum]|uniref:DinB family protein n=1 Tax=Cohnella herbarum TaxID=2728023 RepID=A0A7Z2VHB9_9BACL|nr:DinB family protein [Cohnella herbarum]QJD83173.1 DinB family protein [Cohnella herbarum]
MNQRPAKEEYAEYYDQYVRLVPEGKISDILARQLEQTSAYLSDIPEQIGNFRYAPDKWSLKEVIGHINDNERIMAYRLLRIARGDKTSLAGYDQDEFMKGVNFDGYSLADLIDDYISVRKATLTLIRGLTDEQTSRSGTANDNAISARALAYIISGHETHHINIIRERYRIN